MDVLKEQLQLKKRIENSKQVNIVFPIKGNLQTFNVVDEDGFLKYDGFVKGAQPSDEDSCKCKSFENGNHTKAEGDYIATHGYAFQCKHILEARVEACKKKLDDAFKNSKSHVEALSN